MVRLNRKFATKLLGVALSAAVLFNMGIPAKAGDINENEQRIIGFYNQVFSYDGELYVATEAAKAEAYSMLVDDGCDLTAAQVDSYINQAWGNIENGIKQGYLIPYEEPTTEEITETTTEQDGDTTTEQGGETDTTTEQGGETDATTEQGGETDATTEQGGETDATTEQGGETDATTEQGGETDATTEQGGDTTTEQVGDTTTEQGGSNNTDNTTDNSNNNNENNSSEESWIQNPGSTDNEATTQENVDVDQVVEELNNNQGTAYDSEGNEVSPEEIKETLDKDDTLTIEQYENGTIYIIDADGNVIYKASYPVKNTGYDTGDKAIMVLIILVGCVVLGIVFKTIRRKRYFIPCIAVGIVGVLAIALGVAGKGLIAELGDSWKSIWIQGAPQYSYSGNVNHILEEEPLFGALYGEISCDNIDLRAPVYYGDDANIFSKGLGSWIGSALPGKAGTTLIGGHDTTFFAPLEKISEGDILTVSTSYGCFKYKVTGTKVAGVKDRSAYALSKEEDALILYTCYPFGQTDKERLDRFFVYAERVDREAGE